MAGSYPEGPDDTNNNDKQRGDLMTWFYDDNLTINDYCHLNQYSYRNLLLKFKSHLVLTTSRYTMATKCSHPIGVQILQTLFQIKKWFLVFRFYFKFCFYIVLPTKILFQFLLKKNFQGWKWKCSDEASSLLCFTCFQIYIGYRWNEMLF